MNRKSLSLFVLVVFIAGCAGLTGKMASEADKDYVSVIEVPSKTKDQLYVNANKWFVDTFNSAESVIQYQDKEAGKIIGKYIFDHTMGIYYFRVKSTVEVDMKDGKARVHFYDPMYAVVGDSVNGRYSKAANYISDINAPNMEAARAHWLRLEGDLNAALRQSSNW